MDEALTFLRSQGLAHPQEISTGGRPSECWLPGSDTPGEQTKKAQAEPESALCSIARSPALTPMEQLCHSGEVGKEAPPETTPLRQLIHLEEIPLPPNGSLVPMRLEELFEQVRVIGGRLGWVEGVVRVLGALDVPPGVNAAVVEHQDELRLLVPQTAPSAEDLSIFRLRILGTQEEQALAQRKRLEMLRRAVAADNDDWLANPEPG